MRRRGMCWATGPLGRASSARLLACAPVGNRVTRPKVLRRGLVLPRRGRGCALPAPPCQRAARPAWVGGRVEAAVRDTLARQGAAMAHAVVGSLATGRHANTGQARVGTSSRITVPAILKKNICSCQGIKECATVGMRADISL